MHYIHWYTLYTDTYWYYLLDTIGPSWSFEVTTTKEAPVETWTASSRATPWHRCSTQVAEFASLRGATPWHLRWAWADPKIQRRLDWVHGDMGMERWALIDFSHFFKHNLESCYIMLLVYHVEGSVCLLCVAAEWWRCICQLDRCDPVQPATFHRRS